MSEGEVENATGFDGVKVLVLLSGALEVADTSPLSKVTHFLL